MKKMLVVVLTALALSGIQAKGDQKPALVVAKIQVSSDLEIPSKWLADFTARLVDRLEHSQKYSQVFAPGDNTAPQQAAFLRVSLVGFQKGDRALRWLAPLGPGHDSQEKMEAVVVLTGPDGGVQFKGELASTTTWGFYGGKSGQTPRKLADQIVRALP
jgi:hypothetical protein